MFSYYGVFVLFTLLEFGVWGEPARDGNVCGVIYVYCFTFGQYAAWMCSSTTVCINIYSTINWHAWLCVPFCHACLCALLPRMPVCPSATHAWPGFTASVPFCHACLAWPGFGASTAVC